MKGPGRGFALLPVVLLTALVASAAFLLSRQSGMGASLESAAGQTERARYAAEAGLAHAQWKLDRTTGCSGYANLPLTAFEGGSYSATVSPTTGSPVTITAIGSTASGAKLTLTRTVAKTDQTYVVTLQPGPAGKDSYLEPPSANWSNYGGSSTLALSSTFDYPVLEFDLSAMPRGARLSSAVMELHQTSSGTSAGGDTVTVHRMLRWWKEGTRTNGTGTPDGATAVTYDAINPWVTTGGDIEATPAMQIPWTATTGWRQFDITALVQGWVDGVYPNYGLRMAGSAGVNNAKFASGDDPSPAVWPKLTLSFRAPCGWKPADLVAGTVAHWKLDDAAGAVAQDAMGLHHGTLSGGTWATGRVNGALAFNGTSDLVSVPHAAELSLSSVTLAGWVNPASLTGRHVIIKKGTAGTNGNYWLALTDGQIEFGFYNGGVQQFATTGMGLQSGAWRYIAAGYDAAAKTVRIFLDGAEVSVQSTTKALLANADGLTLGRSQSGEYWSGTLDELRVIGRQVNEADAALLAGSFVLQAAADANLRVDSPNRNYGATTALLAQKGGTRRVVARYDLPAQLAGTTVSKARLMMYAGNVAGVDSANPMLLQATPLAEAWTEGTKNGSGTADGTTWTLATATVDWSTQGGSDVPAAAVVTAAPPGFAGGWIEWDVTAMVNDWLTGVRPNYGFLVQNTSNKGDFTFDSREAADSTPRLVIYR